MKKFLSTLFIFIALSFLFSPSTVDAQVTPAPTIPAGTWVIDQEVTFIGKNAARSGLLLDFILQNYNWVCVKQVPNSTQCDNSNNPLAAVWLTTVTYIVVPLLFVIIIATAIIIIATRGRSLTIMRFLPRFIAVILLIFFSFPLLQFFYQFIDVIQGFFLRSGNDPCPSVPFACISQRDLLYVGWDYKSFIGLRLQGDLNSESAFISLLLTKLTALTYYVMVGILILRKIILWLFIIVSPIFPLLLLYYPIRNTGKIWVGEFFRWLLYAPLFAIFLKGLVSLWRNQIPLVFSNPDIGNASKIVYPTAVNILLGGPKQFVTPTNSVNLTETFALYVVSLLMLWGVIILPWILLQIFLDYASNLGVGDSAVMKTLVNKISNLQTPPGQPSHPPAGGGAAINLPFAKKFNVPVTPTAPTGMARELPTSISTSKINQASYMPTAQVKAQVLNLTNMPLPTMRDIAKYDTSLISKDTDRQKETLIIRENLQKIGNPASTSSTTERERFTQIREKLTQESKSGNTLATSILNAANVANKRSVQASTSQIKNVLSQIANPQSAAGAGSTSVINREKLSKMNESLVKAKKEGNSLATSILGVTDKTTNEEIEKLQERILDAKAKGEPIAAQLEEITSKQKAGLPAVNRVQTVSKDDYEAVKQMWKENYQNLEVPLGMAGSRAEWIKDDMSKIDNIINLLSSADQEQVAKGMEEVSSILPFLLVGGFSQSEIISYLKAKQDAAREVAAEIIQDEEDKVSVDVKKTTTGQQTMTASIPEDSGSDEEDAASSLRNISQGTGASAPSQLSNELLTLSNLKLPKLTDIVQYEVRHLTKDKTESERIEKIHEVLSRISNPESVTTTIEREKYEKLKERLTEEKQKGDPTADVILSAVSQLANTASEIDLTLSEIKVVLQQIVNPATVAKSDDRDYYTRLHEYLEKESRENKNQLAQKILNVNESTQSSEIQEIKSQILTVGQQGNYALPQLTGAVTDFAKVKQLKSVIKQIVSSEKETSSTDNQITKIKESLSTASSQGNTLASSLLALNESTTETTLKQTYKQLLESSQKGDQLAASVLSEVSGPGSSADQSLGRDISTKDFRAFIQQIVNPAGISSIEDRNYYTGVHDYIEKESRENNNQLAQKILSVNETTKDSDIHTIKEQLLTTLPGAAPVLPQVVTAALEYNQARKLKEVMNRIVSPLSPKAKTDKKNLTQLHKSLSEESAKGNQLAKSILSVSDSTPVSTLKQIHQNLMDASKKGDPLAKSLLSEVSGTAVFSETNRLQEVKPEDYEEAKKLWEKAYRQYFVPPGFTEDLKGRMEWINKDIADITDTMSLLSSEDPEKKNEGIKKVSNILPFLLLGGFSFNEILTYLNTKLDAARSALKALVEEEESTVSVDVVKEEKPKEMHAVEEEKDTDKQK